MDEKKRSDEIDRDLKIEGKLLGNRCYIVLFGDAKGRRWMRTWMGAMFLNGFSEARSKIRANVVEKMKELIGWAERKGYGVKEENMEAVRHVKAVVTNNMTVEISSTLAQALVDLWADPAIQRTLEHQSEVSFGEVDEYFFGRLSEITAQNYVPSVDDISRKSRSRSSVSIVDFSFVNCSINFHVIDIERQARVTESRKWIHHFAGFPLICMVDIGKYDLLLEEDMTTNHLLNSLWVLDDTINSRWFCSDTSHVCVVLLGRSVFELKLGRGTPLTVCFPEFVGGREYSSAINFVKAKIQALNRFENRKVYCIEGDYNDDGELCKRFSETLRLMMLVTSVTNASKDWNPKKIN